MNWVDLNFSGVTNTLWTGSMFHSNPDNSPVKNSFSKNFRSSGDIWKCLLYNWALRKCWLTTHCFFWGKFFCIHPPLLNSRFSNNNSNIVASILYKKEWASKNYLDHKFCLCFDANFPLSWKISNFVFHCLVLFLEIWDQVRPVRSKLIWFWIKKNMEKIETQHIIHMLAS